MYKKLQEVRGVNICGQNLILYSGIKSIVLNKVTLLSILVFHIKQVSESCIKENSKLLYKTSDVSFSQFIFTLDEELSRKKAVEMSFDEEAYLASVSAGADQTEATSRTNYLIQCARKLYPRFFEKVQSLENGKVLENLNEKRVDGTSWDDVVLSGEALLVIYLFIYLFIYYNLMATTKYKNKIYKYIYAIRIVCKRVQDPILRQTTIIHI